MAALVLLAGAVPAMAEAEPVFAAECAGGVNQGGYNIDTDGKGHLWVNGHRVRLEQINENYWEGAYHGAVFSISSGENAPDVSYTARHGANGICTVVSM